MDEHNRDEARPSAETGPPCPSGAAEFRRLYVILLGVSGIAFGVFVIGVFAYVRLGQGWVDTLDDQVGDVVAARARDLASAGLRREAIQVLREALALRFNDPVLRVWKSRDLAQLLMQEGQYDETFEVARAILALQGVENHDWVSRNAFGELHNALNKAGRSDDALQKAQAWFEAAKAIGDEAAMAQGRYAAGVSLKRLNRMNEALDAFQGAYAIRPTVDSALAAAQLLVDLGRGNEALPLIEFVIGHDDGARRETAKGLKQKIAGARAP